jgi:hypothetical protein
MSSHPEIMPDFLTLEIVKSPSYSAPFSCYFHPLAKEKSLILDTAVRATVWKGRGDGTVSRSLKLKPADLTQLQRKNKGVFPLEKVMATIDGKTRIDAHGESKMPVWGEIFEKEATAQKDPAATSVAIVKVIAEYVSTIQR